MTPSRIYVALSMLVGGSICPLYSVPEKVFWIAPIEGKSTRVITYQLANEQSFQLDNLEISSTLSNEADPLKEMYWEFPDPKRELLSHGLAKLVDHSAEGQSYLIAEKSAKEKGIGAWSLAQTLTVVVQKLKDFSYFIGGGSLIGLLLFLWRSKRVTVAFLGTSSAGKSWLWARLKTPEITVDELEKISPTALPDLDKKSSIITMGKYAIKPLYLDLPGGHPARQVRALLRPWWQSFRKQIWVIVLSTTPIAKVDIKSAEPLKKDEKFISEQLGYLSFPLGLIALRRARPDVIILAVAKADIFCDRDPGSTSGADQKKALESVFAEHIARVSAHCNDAKIPYRDLVCSSLEGWRVDDIKRHIEHALF